MSVSTARDLLRQSDCLIVANSAAGDVTPAVVAETKERLTPCVRSVRAVWTSGPGTAINRFCNPGGNWPRSCSCDSAAGPKTMPA